MLGKEQFQYHLGMLLPDFRQENFLLAVSGGADSMVLLWLFDALNLSFEVAHVNYRLRGEDSEGDQQLVERFCRERNIPVHIYEVTEQDQRPEGSIQLWARNLRYRFFRKIKSTHHLNYLVTAHHLNDQLETFLINLSRGSGLKGLGGMPAASNRILRPLLHFTKKEIYDFAAQHNIPFREDYTNAKNDYLRNRIRNRVIPELTKASAGFIAHFDRSLRLLQETRNFVETSAETVLQNISSAEGGILVIDRGRLSAQHSIVRYHILSEFGFTNAEENAKIFTAETGRQFFSENFRLTVNRNELIIEERTENENTREEIREIILAENETQLKEHNFEMQLSKLIPTSEKTPEKVWNIDLDKITFPLKIRHKKEGDLFYPTGMPGSKKVSKFFKDEKISILAKPKIWLLCDGSDNILGIIPLRQDRRFAENSGSHRIFKFYLT